MKGADCGLLYFGRRPLYRPRAVIDRFCSLMQKTPGNIRLSPRPQHRGKPAPHPHRRSNAKAAQKKTLPAERSFS
jgi:hypothetical protein